MPCTCLPLHYQIYLVCFPVWIPYTTPLPHSPLPPSPPTFPRQWSAHRTLDPLSDLTVYGTSLLVRYQSSAAAPTFFHRYGTLRQGQTGRYSYAHIRGPAGTSSATTTAISIKPPALANGLVSHKSPSPILQPPTFPIISVALPPVPCLPAFSPAVLSRPARQSFAPGEKVSGSLFFSSLSTRLPRLPRLSLLPSLSPFGTNNQRLLGRVNKRVTTHHPPSKIKRHNPFARDRRPHIVHPISRAKALSPDLPRGLSSACDSISAIVAIVASYRNVACMHRKA